MNTEDVRGDIKKYGSYPLSLRKADLTRLFEWKKTLKDNIKFYHDKINGLMKLASLYKLPYNIAVEDYSELTAAHLTDNARELVKVFQKGSKCLNNFLRFLAQCYEDEGYVSYRKCLDWIETNQVTGWHGYNQNITDLLVTIEIVDDETRCEKLWEEYYEDTEKKDFRMLEICEFNIQSEKLPQFTYRGSSKYRKRLETKAIDLYIDLKNALHPSLVLFYDLQLKQLAQMEVYVNQVKTLDNTAISHHLPMVADRALINKNMHAIKDLIGLIGNYIIRNSYTKPSKDTIREMMDDIRFPKDEDPNELVLKVLIILDFVDAPLERLDLLNQSHETKKERIAKINGIKRKNVSNAHEEGKEYVLEASSQDSISNEGEFPTTRSGRKRKSDNDQKGPKKRK
ncbi:hypothetical protein E3Q19_01633 [Wallemia mellicola]|nr:hypothetical protein E3Q19_01633 [Wallemia mellicola]TIC74653.1 hypothetical protein E3Q00_01686 [Wallemia mellicola]